MPTVAVIIIGNEILTGKFADENGPFFIRRLRALGADLRRLVTVPDTMQAISEEVRRCSGAYDLVLTTGGVGPTHDDITFEAVALAFGEEMRVDAGMVTLLERYSSPLNEAAMRMATVPQSARFEGDLRRGPPVMWVHNVAVLPGIPKLVVSKFDSIEHHFRGDEVLTDRLYIDLHETELAARLNAVVAAFPTVDIGSYPRSGEGEFKVILTFESRDAVSLAGAVAAARETIPTVPPPMQVAGTVTVR